MALSICLSVRLSCLGDMQCGMVWFVFQLKRLNAMALSICLSVCQSCFGDRQRGICLYFSEGGLMRWCCPSVCLSVCPVSVICSEVWFVFQRRWLNAMALSICLSVRPSCLGDRQRGICLYFSEGGLMRWHCPSVSLSVRPVSVIGSEVFVCISAKAA